MCERAKLICSEGYLEGLRRQERVINSRRVGGEGGGAGEEVWVMIGHLCEGEPSLVVDFEDLLDGVDVGGCPQVQTQVVLACCAHDLPGRSLHGVGQPRVNNILLRGTSNSGLEVSGRDDGDGSSLLAKFPL